MARWVRVPGRRGWSGRRLWLFGVGATVLLLVPTVSTAGTAEVRPPNAVDGDVVYSAVAGEANDVRVTSMDPYTIRIVDLGAVIEAREGCRAIDPHTVDCARPPLVTSLPDVHVHAGDREDKVSLDGVEGTADGGPGDDVVQNAGDFYEVTLTGGPGRDHLIGGPGDETLIDGDAVAGPDVFDGRDGTDIVSYAGREAPITIDLETVDLSAVGADRDTFESVEGIEGGSGDDVLFGDQAQNWLEGGPGDDALSGRSGSDRAIFGGRGSDRIKGEAGRDLLRGGPGPDEMRGGRGHDTVSGGSGADMLAGQAGGDELKPGTGRGEMLCGAGSDTLAFDSRQVPFGDIREDCEWGRWGVGQEELDAPTVTLHPRLGRDAGVAVFEATCDSTHGFPTVDARRAVIRATGSARLVAAGAVVYEDAPPLGNLCKARYRTFDVPLTDRGRRLVRRPAGVLVTVTLKDRSRRVARWQVRLTQRGLKG